MKLHLANSPGQNRVTAYGPGYITVNGVRHDTHLLMTAETVTAWEIDAFESLTREHFRSLGALAPEIVILGTGAVQRFPRPDHTRGLLEAGVGVEIMDTAAACRTFNILVSEGRRVVAAILLG